MEKKEVSPEPQWHELSSYCDKCKDKLLISKLIANSKGQIVFKLTCFRCGDEFYTELTTKLLVGRCFDMDFLALAGIKEG